MLTMATKSGRVYIVTALLVLLLLVAADFPNIQGCTLLTYPLLGLSSGSLFFWGRCDTL